jgi:aryl-alcohol dehydrogenase-like predicted oxidoreductase
MAKVGYGTYRVSIKSDTHYESLKYAIESGCSVIDTSSNYTNGDSERLIGKILREVKMKPLIISKVGYIQGDNIENLTKETSIDLVELSESLKHSIHPNFIEDQLTRTLQRLGVDSIDVYLLHNPEYYLKLKDSTSEEYYSRIEKAFAFLETKVQQGKIKSYGISSNTFVDPKDNKESTDLERVYSLVKGREHNFKYIQFPLNLIELGALERQFSGDHLIERAQALGLKTISNRPLNAFLENGLLRLANYTTDEKLTAEYAEHIFIEKVESIVAKWESDKDEGDESLFEIPIFNQISNIWYKQNSKDAVDQIFFKHFFPFVASVWGKDLTTLESKPFYELYDLALDYSKKNMNKRAEQFKETAISQGLLFESDKNLSVMAVEKYFSFGIDIVLVGMREKNYVEAFKGCF